MKIVYYTIIGALATAEANRDQERSDRKAAKKALRKANQQSVKDANADGRGKGYGEEAKRAERQFKRMYRKDRNQDDFELPVGVSFGGRLGHFQECQTACASSVEQCSGWIFAGQDDGSGACWQFADNNGYPSSLYHPDFVSGTAQDVFENTIYWPSEDNSSNDLVVVEEEPEELSPLFQHIEGWCSPYMLPLWEDCKTVCDSLDDCAKWSYLPMDPENNLGLCWTFVEDATAADLEWVDIAVDEPRENPALFFSGEGDKLIQGFIWKPHTNINVVNDVYANGFGDTTRTRCPKCPQTGGRNPGAYKECATMNEGQMIYLQSHFWVVLADMIEPLALPDQRSLGVTSYNVRESLFGVKLIAP